MIDLNLLATLDVEHITEEEADNWCEKLIQYKPEPIESNKNLFSLFNFTQSLLRYKSIQTNVLIEEIQKVGSRLESVDQELDRVKTPDFTQTQDELIRLRSELDNREDDIDDQKREITKLDENLKQKDREISSLKIEIETLKSELRETTTSAIASNNSGSTSTISQSILIDNENQTIEQQRQSIEEKNSQIEQLLDRLYDSDRINLDLAEQLAKVRVESAKLSNDLKINESRSSMLEAQVEEFRHLNESLITDRDRKEREINEIRSELEQRTSVLFLGNGSKAKKLETDENQTTPIVDITTNFYQELTNELKRSKSLLQTKQQEIDDLRDAIQELTKNDRTVLQNKKDEIERLEHELEIVTLHTKHDNDETRDPPETAKEDQLLIQQLRRRVRKLRKDKLELLERISELEQEAGSKDEDLEKHRRRSALFIGKNGSLKKVLEENAVLSRMIKFRDEKINFLIDQLNRHHLTVLQNGKLNHDKGETAREQEIGLMDQVIALGVERDVLNKQLDALKSHLETAQKENLELQMGMKEILDGLRSGDTASDLIIECPSLERVCVLLENRLIYPGLESTSDVVDLSKVVLLKSELDFVRGQNEQLRTELKQIRGDFLSVIDEYTNDILENWTIPIDGITMRSSLEDDDGSQSVSVTTISNQETFDTGSQTLETIDPSTDSNSNDLLQNYYQQMKRLQNRPIVRRNHLRATKVRSNKRLTNKRSSKGKAKIETADVSIETDCPMIRLINCSTQTDTIQPEVFTNHPITECSITISHIKQILFDNSDMRQELLDDHQIQEYLLQNEEFIHELLNNQAARICILDDSEAKRKLVEDEEVRMDLIEDQHVRSKLLDDPRYVENVVSCLNCPKYQSMIVTIRGLIEKERQQMKSQETKLIEQNESLKSNLKLIQIEYNHDLTAKDEELNDLRQKLNETSNKVTKLLVKSTQKPKTLDLENNDLKLKFLDNDSHAFDTQGTESKTTKSILETIIVCLQNCLKQKDEALSEYRTMMDEMRQSYSIKAKESESQNSQNIIFDTPTNQLEPEKLYQELYLKPCTKHNEELLLLLQKTFTELNSLRNRFAKDTNLYHSELEKLNHTLKELQLKHKETCKERDKLEQQNQMFQNKEKIYQDKIESLNTKILELTKRTSQLSSETTKKKKTENAIFQESADLRSKITDLTNELKKSELDRWTIEKKFSTERNSYRSKLLEREQTIAQSVEQISKLQTLVAKLDKKLQQSEKRFQQEIIKLTQVHKENESKGTQTNLESMRKVRFEDECSSSPSNRTVIIERHQIHVSDNDYAQKHTEKDTNKIILELQKMLEQSIRREKLASMIKEVSVVGADLIEATSNIEIETTSNAHDQDDPTISEKGINTISSQIMSSEEIYEQLIDMQFQRLVSENATLKVRLKMAELEAPNNASANSLHM
ncbi:hypothetical protein BLOT_008644 [Blomia tropicalis]|nr:hypothetical protein BLOT_008644 [Blomia tropicalis]